MGPVAGANGKGGVWAGYLVASMLLMVLGVAAPALAAPGDADTSFGSDGNVHTLVAPDHSLYGGGASEVAVQPDGKVLAAGLAKNEADEYRLAFARHNADGSLDDSFGSGGKLITDLAFLAVGGIALEPDNDILVAGTVRNGVGDLDFMLARFNPDGSPDASLGPAGSAGNVTASFAPGHEEARDLAVQPDGRILVAGHVPGPMGGAENFLVARFHEDGSVDTSFGEDRNGDGTPDGSIGTDFGNNANWSGAENLWAMALQPDGKIVLAGETTVATQIGGTGTMDIAMARYTPNGTLDADFSGDGKVVTDLFGGTDEQSFSVALQPDGKIVLGGEYHNGSDTDYALTRYNTDGSLDDSFDSDGKVTTDFRIPYHGGSYDSVRDLAIGRGGKIFAAGSDLARYNPNGSLDTSFGEGGKSAAINDTVPDAVQSIALQPDDKAVLALRHENFHVARYHGGDDRTAPGPATALAASAQNSDVSLAWNNPAGADFEATRIVSRTGGYGGGPFDGTKVYEGNGTSHTDTRVKNGTYYYTAFARDASGNWAAAARASVEVNVAPPAAIIDGPSGTIHHRSPSFSFSSNEPNVRFDCELTYSPQPSDYLYPCSSPKQYQDLEDAEYFLHVRATNELGNSSVTTHSFTVDATPTAQITSGPDYDTPSEPSVSFEFSTVQPPEMIGVSGYECRIDDEAFTPCASPKTYSGLSDGHHHFRVRPLDAEGRPGREDAEVWRVDGTPPDIWIFLGPVDNDNTGFYNVGTATFGYSSNDPTLEAFECSLDGAPFTECPNNRISYSGLAEGEHTFRARGVDALGHVSETPASRTWVVDTTKPGASIDSGPSGAISAGSARFELSSDEAGSTFRCKLDDEWGFTACDSPQQYSGLANGEHTFSVKAVDRAGNVGSAVSRTWRIEPETTGQQTVAASGTLTTDTENDGATAFDPLETSVTSPTGGTVSVTETAATAAAPSDYAFLGQQANITAPASTPENPLKFGFLIDSSLIPTGETENTIQVFRNGTQLEACADQSGVALPDPCVLSRETQDGGDVKITVLTSRASYWNLGVVANAAPTVKSVTPANLSRTAPAGASVTATFSEAMRATTLNTGSFVLVKRGTTTPIGAKVTYASTARKATLNPKRDLKPGTTYVATVKGGANGAADAAGNPLATDKSWTFTVKKR